MSHFIHVARVFEGHAAFVSLTPGKTTCADLGCGVDIYALHDVPEACALVALFVQFMPDHVFHSLRKGFATQLENAGQPLNVVARLMGHAQDNQSFGNYSDGLVFDELKLAINRVDWSQKYP